MDQIQPMNPARFLDLLNKSPRTTEEENEVQKELLRQGEEAKAKEAANKPAETPTEQVAEVTPTEPVVEPQPEVAAEQPAVEQAQPVEETPAEVPAENVPYTLDQLQKELQDAINFVKTQERTLAVEMATASLEGASYWIKLATEGK